MPTTPSIRIDDDPEMRLKLYILYESASQQTLAAWALDLAERAFERIGYDYAENGVLRKGFDASRAWMRGDAQIREVKSAGLRIQQISKNCRDKPLQAAFCVAGQAIGTGHRREHALVASDYAIRLTNLLYPDAFAAAKAERLWQIERLTALLNGGSPTGER